MSVLSQFFNRGSAGSGFVDVETLILSGGGGGGDGSGDWSYGGGGGGGAVYYGFLSIEPGSTCSVVVGAGGDRANGGTNNRGSNGGDSSVTTPVGTYRVAGGGGGGGYDNKKGRVGGTGGGDWSSANLLPYLNPFSGVLVSIYDISNPNNHFPEPMVLNEKNASLYSIGGGNREFFTLVDKGPYSQFGNYYTNGQEMPLQFKNGAYHGYSGGGALVSRVPDSSPTVTNYHVRYAISSGCGGGAGSASNNYHDTYSPDFGGTPNGVLNSLSPLNFTYAIGNAFISDIGGVIEKYGQGGLSRTFATRDPVWSENPAYLSTTNNGYGGYGGYQPGTPAPGTNEAPTNGNSGVVIMRYPTEFAEASFSDPTAVTDLSPVFAGYRTYKFTASATITFPQ